MSKFKDSIILHRKALLQLVKSSSAGGSSRGKIYSRSCWWWVRNGALDFLPHLPQQQHGQLTSILMIPINLWFFCVGSQFPGFFYNVIKTGVIMWFYARLGSLEMISLTHTLLFSIHWRVSSSILLAPETTASVLILYDKERKGRSVRSGELWKWFILLEETVHKEAYVIYLWNEIVWLGWVDIDRHKSHL